MTEPAVDRLLSRARSHLDRLSPEQAYAAQQEGALIVDIRLHAQRVQEGEVPDALVIERNVLEWRLDPTSPARLPEARPDLHVMVLCSEGYSSSLAAAALRDVGVPAATDVTGGFGAWRAAGLPARPGGTPAGSRTPPDPDVIEERSAMSVTDELLANSRRYAEGFDKGDLPLPPAKGVAVLACMDARLNPYGLLGLREGDAHIIRNAGGVVTADELRSLAISQRLLGTREILLIHHTDCGMLTFTDDAFRRQIEQETGVKPAWAAEAFTDLDEDVRQSIGRIRAESAIPHRDAVRGFVYDVHDGTLREVPQTPAA